MISDGFSKKASGWIFLTFLSVDTPTTKAKLNKKTIKSIILEWYNLKKILKNITLMNLTMKSVTTKLRVCAISPRTSVNELILLMCLVTISK